MHNRPLIVMCVIINFIYHIYEEKYTKIQYTKKESNMVTYKAFG